MDTNTFLYEILFKVKKKKNPANLYLECFNNKKNKQ